MANGMKREMEDKLVKFAIQGLRDFTTFCKNKVPIPLDSVWVLRKNPKRIIRVVDLYYSTNGNKAVRIENEKGHYSIQPITRFRRMYKRCYR